MIRRRRGSAEPSRWKSRCHPRLTRADHLAWHRAYYRANRDRLIAQARERYRLNRPIHLEQKRSYHLRIRYGILIEHYERLLREQRGHCAICGASPSRSRLAVDHDHRTGKVRGLLCFSCNYRLGQLETDWCERALKYLRNWVRIRKARTTRAGRAQTDASAKT